MFFLGAQKVHLEMTERHSGSFGNKHISELDEGNRRGQKKINWEWKPHPVPGKTAGQVERRKRGGRQQKAELGG